MSDELEIRDLVNRFTDAVNCRRPDDLAQLFTSDGEWVVPGMPETIGDAIPGLLATLLGQFDFLVQMLLAGRVVVDGDTARARWHIGEVARATDGGASQFYGVYHDELVRTAEGWRFARRRFDFTYRGRFEMGGKVYELGEPDGGDGPWLG
jgi:uncharacterized protein (TIGR02246 family)